MQRLILQQCIQTSRAAKGVTAQENKIAGLSDGIMSLKPYSYDNVSMDGLFTFVV